ncbi:MAG: hypothetical protein O7D91_10050 [Planctomycetota bacterium]|nr:hypothetical protein [Planctomycetota bacterium]
MDSRKNQSLVLCACGILALAIAPSTSADIVGMEAEVRTDLTICQDTSQDYIDEPLTVCNCFAVFDDPTKRLVYVSDADINQDRSMQKGETS